VTNLGRVGMTMRQISGLLSGRLELHPNWRKHNKFEAMCSECWLFFLTL
jgi:hypothetical protein